MHITIGIYNRILANQQRTGMMEELGELSHVDLKEEQAIREYSPEALVNYPNKATEDRKDAIGDLLIYTINYCNIHGLDLEEILNTVGSKVLKRDWNADREAGGEKVSGPSE